MYLVSLLLVSSCSISPVFSQSVNDSPSSFGAPVDASFDYIVVGGGNAGLTIAAALASNPNLTIAVIEAGGFYEDAGNTSIVPAYAPFFSGTDPADVNPLVDWGFSTSPQVGAGNRVLHYARGRTLGGSSARNFMVYHRPTAASLDLWSTEVDDVSYQFEDFLPSYQQGLNYTPPDLSNYKNSTLNADSNAFAPSSGPLHVSWAKTVDAFGSWIQKAFIASGMAGIDGFNSGKLLGSSFSTYTIDPSTATRSSSESSFLQQALGSTSLKVYNNTLAQRLLFNDQNQTTGVSVTTAGTTYVLSARKEVIVSAGVFQSPQLLMVSGIGPKALLESMNISVIQDLPGVGQNMWDQPWFAPAFRVTVPTNLETLGSPAAREAAALEWQVNATGPLSSVVTAPIGWEKLPNRSSLSDSTLDALAHEFPPDWPEIEYVPASGYLGDQSNYANPGPLDGYNYASLGIGLNAPFSRGNISIRSNRMEDAPIINPNWLADPRDQEFAVAAFRRALEILDYLKNNSILILSDNGSLTAFPDAAAVPSVGPDGDEAILKWIQSAIAPLWHAAGTCKMGRSDDRMAVIDSKARVYGVVKGLRVVDASSFPFLPPGHPQSTVYALAQKIARDILEGS